MRYVYFIKPVGADGPIKVGLSERVAERVAQLSTLSPERLEVLASIEGDTTLERRFHAKYLSFRRHGEWFDCHPIIAADIASICAGTFDIASLPDPICLAPLDRNRRTICNRERTNYDPELLGDIDRFCRIHKMTASTFGRRAIGDPAIVRRMRQGSFPRLETVVRVRNFMATTPYPLPAPLRAAA